VVLSLHKNPVVREVILSELDGIDRVELIEPPDYFEFVRLLDSSYATLTDSGGIQEEAPSLGVPVLVARETTERPEGVEAGCAKLVGTSEEGVYAALMELFTNSAVHDRMGKVVNPYGDGKAAERIAEILSKA
jgi:UDP-N-acetylglucosamine 2-epimerase (non-hydrolysing)